MEIVNQWPPNIDTIRKHFDIVPTTVFTYGDCIYNPGGFEIPEHVVAHEEVHSQQQANPDAWWNRYIAEGAFRLDQELEAFRAQWAFIKTEVKDRNKRVQILNHLARELSSPVYGSIISKQEAYKAIGQ